MREILNIINDVVFKPKKFFHTIERHGIKEPLKFLIIMSLFTQIFIVFHFLKSGIIIPLDDFGISYSYTPSLTLPNFLIFYLLSVIWTLFFSFLWPATTHVFIKIWRRKARYKNTFKSIVYSGTPNYITVPFYIIMIGTGFSLLMTQNKILWMIFVLSVVIQLAAHIYSMYLKLMSMSRLQQVNMLIAYLCIYVFPTALIVIVELLIIALVIFI